MVTGFNVYGVKGMKTDYLPSISWIHVKSKKRGHALINGTLRSVRVTTVAVEN